jgi:hypothetical protein
MEPDVTVVEDPAELPDAGERALELVRAVDVERRQAVARENTWDTRTDRLIALVQEELGS